MELNQLSPIWRQLASLDAAAEDHLELTNEIRTSGLSGSSYLRQEPRPGGFEKRGQLLSEVLEDAQLSESGDEKSVTFPETSYVCEGPDSASDHLGLLAEMCLGTWIDFGETSSEKFCRNETVRPKNYGFGSVSIRDENFRRRQLEQHFFDDRF